MERSHRPLRLSQSLRTIWGRGYSGWAFLGETSAAQRVLSGPAAGCQSAAKSEETERIRQKNRSLIGTVFISGSNSVLFFRQENSGQENKTGLFVGGDL